MCFRFSGSWRAKDWCVPLLSNCRKLGKRSWPERLSLLEAFFLLAVGRTVIVLFSFSRLAGWLGLVLGDQPHGITRRQTMAACTIGWAVRTASVRTPWSSTCLVQALAAAAMLRRRKIPCTLFLGVARDVQQIIAHAWLCCGDDVLTGQEPIQRFAQISAFSLTYTEASPGRACA
jgi:hypothetical protein